MDDHRSGAHAAAGRMTSGSNRIIAVGSTPMNNVLTSHSPRVARSVRGAGTRLSSTRRLLPHYLVDARGPAATPRNAGTESPNDGRIAVSHPGRQLLRVRSRLVPICRARANNDGTELPSTGL